jgi:hypothetical protein
MKFPSAGIVVSEADLGTILERGGEYADDAVFMEEAARIARRALRERSEELRDILDQPFGKGLLKKLDMLDHASEDELSRMLHMLTREEDTEPQPAPSGLLFSYDHIKAIKAYVLQKIEMLLSAEERGGDIYYTHKERMEYEHYLRHIENYLEPVDVPDKQ